MNLADIRGRVGRALQYAPNVQSREDDWNDEINDKYMELCMDHPWMFLERTEDLTTRVDETSVSAVAIDGVTSVTLSSGTPSDNWVGHTLEEPTSGQTFSIVSVDGTRIYIDTAFSGSGTKSFNVRYYKYQLPRRCLSVLGIMTRTDDLGKMVGIDRETEERRYLDPDVTGTPEVWMPEDDVLDRAPRTIAGAAVTGGSLVLGTEYRYVYVFVQQGRVSAPSLVQSVTTAGINLTVNLTDIESTGAASGIKKKVYRESARSGVFKYVATLDETTTAWSDDGSVTASETDVLDNDAGPYRYIRFWPRPTESQTMKVRHLFRPPRLMHDADVPTLPANVHQILVHLTVAELAPRYGGEELGSLHRRKAEKLVGRLMRRTSKDDDRELVMGMWTQDSYTRARINTAVLD